MERCIRLGTALGLAGIMLLAHVSLATAHAGETHSPADTSPWPIAGPIIAILISGAAYWLTNRDDRRRPSPSSSTDPLKPATGSAADRARSAAPNAR